MSELPIGPFYRDAGMKKTAMSLADIEKRIEWVKANTEPMARRISTLNHELEIAWASYETWDKTISDDTFISNILTPLQQVYGVRPWPLPPRPDDPRLKAIYSIDELEARTRPRR